MSENIFAKLKSHRTAQLSAMMQLGAEYQRHDLVFSNEFGGPIDLKNIRVRNFSRILNTAGLEGFRIYDLRHSMASLMLQDGVNVKVVSERLGHASIVLTLDTYAHVLPGMQENATARLGAVLYG